MSDASVQAVDGRAVVRVGGSELLDPLFADLSEAVAASTAEALEAASRSGNFADSSEAARDLSLAYRNQSQTAASQAAMSASSIEGIDNFYATRTAGETATPVGKVFTTVDGSNNLVYYLRTTTSPGGSTLISPGAFLTLAGAQTITGLKTFQGITRFVTNGDRVGVTSGSTPLVPEALFHILNEGSLTNTLRIDSYWPGVGSELFENNDSILVNTHSRSPTNGSRRTWGGSYPNYSILEPDIHETGEFIGLYGWSVGLAGHKGRVNIKIGVRGRAGFQGTGAPAGAQIDLAIGIDGQVYAEAVGAIIKSGRAGNFVSTITPGTGIVENNHAVYAEASGGMFANWAYFGQSGDFYQRDRAFFGDGSFTEALAGQSVASINARGGKPNALGFGSGDPAGFGSNVGATAASGNPFLAFSAEADPTGNTFRTRGKLGSLIWGDLAGAVIFSRLTNANAGGQAPTDDLIWRPDGKFVFLKNPRLLSGAPASAAASGEVGEIAWDSGFLYVCTADNTWKRAALATW